MISEGITIAGAEGIFGGEFSVEDDYYFALYEEGCNLSETTMAYTTVGEVRGAGYTPGGRLLGRPRVRRDGRCITWDWDDPQWPNSSIPLSCGGLIYNKTRGRSLCVVGFEPTMSRNGPFKVTLPPPTAAEAVLRFNF